MNKDGLVAQHGKKPNQKLKPYLVMQYLLRNSDENHAVSAPRIVGYLQESGIDAERRSIYRDIEEINKAMLMIEQDMYLDEAEEELEEYGDDVRYIIYDPNKKGFYVRERRFEFDEIRLAAESIYSSKFLTESEAESFVNLICSFVSDYQAEQIRHDVLLTDRVKTKNKNTFRNVADINYAMKKEYDKHKKIYTHLPEKISFKYLKTTINDVKNHVERRKGERYIVSPYALLLNDGNYYMLAFDDKAQKILTYRVDRMQDVRHTGQPRDGEEEFHQIDMKTYTQRVFSMFEGKQEHVVIRFINPLLDAVIDRFGTKGVQYSRADEKHFDVSVNVDISDQFFGWICGFGKKARIIAPQRVADQFKEHIEIIKSNY